MIGIFWIGIWYLAIPRTKKTVWDCEFSVYHWKYWVPNTKILAVRPKQILSTRILTLLTARPNKTVWYFEVSVYHCKYWVPESRLVTSRAIFGSSRLIWSKFLVESSRVIRVTVQISMGRVTEIQSSHSLIYNRVTSHHSLQVRLLW